MYLNFTPHSWYKHFAIRDNRKSGHDQAQLNKPLDSTEGYKWAAYTDNGNTYRIDEIHADTLRELKKQINAYYARQAARDTFNRQMIGEK